MTKPPKRPMSRRVTTDDDQSPRRAPTRAERRRKVVAFVAIAGLLLSTGGAVVAVIAGALLGSNESPIATTIPTTAVTEPPAVALQFPPQGASAPEVVTCPEPDGSSPRTTSFGATPPVCLQTAPDGSIDTGVDYLATISTTAGDLTYQLTTAVAPQTVNTFVFLARFGFWDGAPFDTILPLGWAESGTEFSDVVTEPNVADRPPGFTIASEAPDEGMVSTPGMLAMVPGAQGVSEPGRLLVALGDRAAGLPVATTFFGVLLDGAATLTALQQAGTQSGRPSQQITITSITVEAEG